MGVQLAVDPPPPAWQGADGTGQTVGIAAFDSFLPSDVADYINLIGLPATKRADVTQVHVNGGATLGADQDEVLLDIAQILSIAPGAKIKVFDAPFTGAGTSFQNAVQRHDQRRRKHHHQQLRLLRKPDDAGRRARHRDHPADGGRGRHQRLQRQRRQRQHVSRRQRQHRARPGELAQRHGGRRVVVDTWRRATSTAAKRGGTAPTAHRPPAKVVSASAGSFHGRRTRTAARIRPTARCRTSSPTPIPPKAS